MGEIGQNVFTRLELVSIVVASVFLWPLNRWGCTTSKAADGIDGGGVGARQLLYIHRFSNIIMQ